ncbi:MAG: ABC1 kinase family protein [Myxococcota bacterium]
MADKPPSRLRRLARLTSLTSRVTSSFVGERVKSAIRGEADMSKEDMDRLFVQNTGRIVDTMSNLKGAAMKLGQGMALAARSLDLPPEVANQLSKLNKDAEPVPFHIIREDVEKGLGMPLEEAYASFDETPLGTASLAQAHRAVMHDGSDVVVKVLHRGIDDSVATDLLALKAVLLGSRVLRRDKSEVDAAFAEIQARLEEELDYLQEAANIHEFHQLWDSDPDVRVPNVYGSHSTERVLTLDRLDGVHVEEFAEIASPEAKQRAGETLARLYYTMAFRHRVLHADPHPGNYLFTEDGSVGLLDFGCVKRFDEFWIGRYCQIARHAIDGERALALYESREMGALTGKDKKASEALWEFFDALAHHLRKGAFELGSEDDNIVEQMRPEGRALGNHPSVRVPPDVIFLHRALGGIYSIAKRLHPTLDPGALFMEVCDEAISRAAGRG